MTDLTIPFPYTKLMNDESHLRVKDRYCEWFMEDNKYKRINFQYDDDQGGNPRDLIFVNRNESYHFFLIDPFVRKNGTYTSIPNWLFNKPSRHREIEHMIFDLSRD